MSLTLYWRDALSQSSKTRTEDIQKHFHRNLRRAFDICSQMPSNSKKRFGLVVNEFYELKHIRISNGEDGFQNLALNSPVVWNISMEFLKNWTWISDCRWIWLIENIYRLQYRETNDERERNKEMTCQLGTSAGQRIALAQSKLRILQSIARKKMVEARGIIKWAKIPKSLPTLFFLCGRRPFSSPPTLTFRPIHM